MSAATSLKPYQHDPLPDPTEYIRLVKIHPAPKKEPLTITIEAYERQSAPAYGALSYTWGDPQATRGILANGKLLHVTQNCWYALGQLRLNNVCSYYWIDAICINQKDDTEKSAQVNLMGSVYRDAVLGAIAVGRHDRATTELFRKLDELGIAQDPTETKSTLKQVDHDTLECLAQGLIALGMHSYWNRLWIVQEFSLPATNIILCGNSAIEFEAIEAVTHALTKMSRGEKPAFETRYDWVVLASTPMSATIQLRQIIRESSDGRTAIEKLLNLLGRRECEDIRDRIFGILSLVRWEHDIEPLVADYSLSKIELAAKALRLYKGHPHHYTSRVLNLLDFGRDDSAMWSHWKRRMLERQILDMESGLPRFIGQRTSFIKSVAEAYRILDNTEFHRCSDHWVCLLPRVGVPMEDTAGTLEDSLASNGLLLPAACRPGDILVRISHSGLPVDYLKEYLRDYSDRFSLVVRATKAGAADYSIVGHVLSLPENDILSLRNYGLESTWAEGFRLHVDDDDLLFWVWQQIHWGSKRCETLEDREKQMEVFAADFCHAPQSSFATSWTSHRLHVAFSDV